MSLLEQGQFNVRLAVRSQSSYEKLLTLKPIAPYKSQLDSIIVPDITIPGAYDEAVKGVTHIIHVASPIPSAHTTDHEADLIQPAIQGTVGILQSAHKAGGIKKVIITASVLALTSFAFMSTGATINGTRAQSRLSFNGEANIALRGDPGHRHYQAIRKRHGRIFSFQGPLIPGNR